MKTPSIRVILPPIGFSRVDAGGICAGGGYEVGGGGPVGGCGNGLKGSCAAIVNVVGMGGAYTFVAHASNKHVVNVDEDPNVALATMRVVRLGHTNVFFNEITFMMELPMYPI